VRRLTAGWVVPVGAPPLARGQVAIDGGRIEWVGPADAQDAPGGLLLDLGPGILLPGLVNAHTHLELSFLSGRLEGLSGFVDWVRGVVEGRGVDAEVAREAAGRAIRELEESGTVAVGDVSNALGHLDLLEGARLRSVVFHELLAWDPRVAAAVARSAERRVSERAPLSGKVQVRLAAHAPHSVSPALLEELRRLGGIASIHLAESREESRFLQSGDGPWAGFLAERGLGEVPFVAPGVSPVRYLNDIGALERGRVVVHCVQTDAEDARLLKRAGVSVAVCLRSNRRLGVGLPPVPRLLEEGVPLCLGTDSLASVESLRMEDEMHALREAFPDLPASAIVEMATRGGARALGFPDLGSIAAGQTAALAYADVEDAGGDPLERLVSGRARIRALSDRDLGSGDAT